MSARVEESPAPRRGAEPLRVSGISEDLSGTRAQIVVRAWPPANAWGIGAVFGACFGFGAAALESLWGLHWLVQWGIALATFGVATWGCQRVLAWMTPSVVLVITPHTVTLSGDRLDEIAFPSNSVGVEVHARKVTSVSDDVIEVDIKRYEVFSVTVTGEGGAAEVKPPVGSQPNAEALADRIRFLVNHLRSVGGPYGRER
jgi:hypothetical protein